jgi:hypothetical protein
MSVHLVGIFLLLLTVYPGNLSQILDVVECRYTGSQNILLDSISEDVLALGIVFQVILPASEKVWQLLQ